MFWVFVSGECWWWPGGGDGDVVDCLSVPHAVSAYNKSFISTFDLSCLKMYKFGTGTSGMHFPLSSFCSYLNPTLKAWNLQTLALVW